MKANNNSHIGKIDVLRGIAILGVFLFHSQQILFHITRSNMKFSPFTYGFTGVHLFLLISGFLIHYSYLSSKRGFSLKEFYSKRFWRIYPPYFLVTMFFVLLEGGQNYFMDKQGFINLSTHLLLIHNFFNSTIFGINSSFWSLALEMQLYFIYPLLLYIIGKIGINKSFLLLLFTSFLLTVVWIFLGYKTINYETFVLRYWVIWGAGALLADRYHKKIKLFTSFVSFLLVVIFFIALLYFFHDSMALYLFTLLWLAFFEWFLYASFITNNNLIFRVLSTIGICSYSIYLIHQPLLKDMYSFFEMVALKCLLQLTTKYFRFYPIFRLIYRY